MTVSLYRGEVTLTVEMAFTSATDTYAVWDVATWDSGTWGPDLTWTDVTAYVRQFSTQLGRNRETGHYNAATATIVLDNRDARFSAENLAGPYVVGGVSGVRPLRPIRIRATRAGTTYPVFFGRMEAFQETYPGYRDAVVAVPCVDGIARLSAFDGFEQTAIGGGETVGARIHRILDNAAWGAVGAGGRSVDVSGTLVQATTLARAAWEELLLTADSDGGAIWVDPDGTIVFEAVGALFENTRSNTVQATFSDTGAGLRYTGIEEKHDGDLTINIAALACVGGTLQTVADNTSRALYGDRRFSRSDLIATTDTQIRSLASYMVQTSAQPEKRISALVVSPRKDPVGLWPQALGRRIRDRVSVTVHNPQSGTTLTRECFVDGIEHTVTPDQWTTTFRLSSASMFASSALQGRWNSALWDSNAWGF